MKIFLDTANITDIKKWLATGLIDGVTTNPTHLSKEGGDPKKQVLEICSLLPEGEVSVEVTEKDPEAVYNQAKIIADLADNVVVKIPCHADYYAVIKRLVDEDVKLNITLVFTMLQGLMMSKMGVHVISPFVGRLDDIDIEGVELVSELCEMIDQYGFETQVLAASIRSVRHFNKAVMAGADIVTLPLNVFEQAITHPLTNQGMAKFDADWQKLGFRQFP
ncbi:MAG: fructose-6-phosphate aldolase [Candidatus Dependentiae bacterium]|nr:fructose-6-phosphate aldolase [Candidatus Dependentiae bacterium]